MSMFGSPRPGGMFSGLANNADTMIMAGLGLMSGRNPQEQFAGAMQGYGAGSQMDRQRREQAEKDKLAADRKALIERMTTDPNGPFKGMSPSMGELFALEPELGIRAAYERLTPKDPNYMAVDGRVFDENAGTFVDEPAGVSGDGQHFRGNSADVQGVNALIDANKITYEQGAQLLAGKVITNPADQSQYFQTPEQLIGAGGVAPPEITQSDLPAPAGVPSSPQMTGTEPQMQGNQLTPGRPQQLDARQERNAQLYSVAAPELKIVEQTFSSLSNLGNQAAGALPLSDFITSAPYQQAKASLRTIVATYLYSTSGATANPGEVETQVDVLMPRPGEKQPSLDDKMNRIRTMVDSIRLGSGATGGAPADNDPFGIR